VRTIILEERRSSCLLLNRCQSIVSTAVVVSVFCVSKKNLFQETRATSLECPLTFVLSIVQANIMSSTPFKPDCLKGKVALVTGGGSGICFEITRQLLLHGCDAAVICGRRAEFLERAAKLLRQETHKQVGWKVCDVRNPDNCVAAVEHAKRLFGRLDILVNGAAGNFLAQAKDLSPKGFGTVMSIDAQGTFNMSHAAYPLLNQSGDAIVINISATLQYGATWWQAHASAAKAAVDSLTRSLALEWGCDQIRVVGIAPGPIANTPGTTKLAPGLEASDVSDMVVGGIPLGRMGETWEIGQAAVYLCTAAYVTGTVLVVDGGEWLYRPPMVPKDVSP
jgi:peroxisomal 2,4-dienoyl-CoA reductase